MIRPGLEDKVYPVTKIAKIVDLLGEEGVPADLALESVRITKAELASFASRVSVSQVIACCRNALRLSRDPNFAYHAGLQFHVSTYGMYGFAMLSSTNFRQTIRFAVAHHQLAAPLVSIDFSEKDDVARLVATPIAHPLIDNSLYRCIVELQFGVFLSICRDIMGGQFAAKAIHLTYDPPDPASAYASPFECDVLYRQPKNAFVFDASWLDQRPRLGDRVVYQELVKLCDAMLAQLEIDLGVSGMVRQFLLENIMQDTRFELAASQLNMSQRTLRRRLHDEHTSFRKLEDELKMELAIKYLRETNLPAEDIASILRFHDEGAFRRAFRRWTQAAPHRFRNVRRSVRTSPGPSRRKPVLRPVRPRRRGPA
jgi:AraC-like DNA-binding protein